MAHSLKTKTPQKKTTGGNENQKKERKKDTRFFFSFFLLSFSLSLLDVRVTLSWCWIDSA
jgi:hypothetical protein